MSKPFLQREGLVIPLEPFLSKLKRELDYDPDSRAGRESWLQDLADADGSSVNGVAKEIRRAQLRPGILLRRVERWCDAIGKHPCFLVPGYYDYCDLEDRLREEREQQRVIRKRAMDMFVKFNGLIGDLNKKRIYKGVSA